MEAQKRLYQEWYKEARKNLTFIMTLPKEIQELDTYGLSTYGDVIEFTVTFPKNDDDYASKIKQILVKLNGGKWLKREFVQHSGQHNLKGECEINGKRLYFTLANVNQPPNCEIIKKTRMEERVYYEAKCNEELEQNDVEL